METIGKYRVIRELGKGATATVYLCVSPDSDRQVAVKLIRFGKDSAAMSRRMRKLFQNEGMVAGGSTTRISSKVYEAVVEDDFAYLAMEYIEGFSLESHIADRQAAAAASRHRHHLQVLHGARQRLPPGHHPSRHQAGQHPGGRGRRAQDGRFRPGAQSEQEHGPRLDLHHGRRLAGLHVAGADQGLSAQPEDRPLFAGRRAVPVADRPSAVPRQQSGDADLPHHQYRCAGCDRAESEPAGGARTRSSAGRWRRISTAATGTAPNSPRICAAVRYQILEEDETVQDTRHFEMLRKLDFFTDFENVELWEVLRICVWREIAPRVAIMREGEKERNFGVLVEGFVEVSIGGADLCRLGPGEVIGEMAFLHPSSSERSASVMTLEPTLFLEINAAALALASEELQERVRSALLGRMIGRLREVNRIAAAGGAPAIEPPKGRRPVGRRQSPGGALELTPM